MPERGEDFKVSTGERQVVRALGSIGGATLLSRVLGFARDMVVALAFGAGPSTGGFFVAFRIPNILRRLLAEGALSTAIIPVFTEYFVTRSASEARRMLRAVLALGLVALGLPTLLGVPRGAGGGPAWRSGGLSAGVRGLGGRGPPPILALALGVLAGGVGQLLVQLPGL